ncbi:hypothetical protein O9993_22845 [Vibrio lentus]|nr:hypothetical protein [Vibrio lentus]
MNEVTTGSNYGALDMQVVILSMSAWMKTSPSLATLIQAASSNRYIRLPKPVTVLVKQTITDNYLAIQLTCELMWSIRLMRSCLKQTLPFE